MKIVGKYFLIISILFSTSITLIAQPTASQPAYRFWSQINERYFYTISETEKQKIIDIYSHLWTYEGIAYYAFETDSEPNLAPVYRFWSPVFTAHFFTISEAERNDFIDNYSDVWTYEGIAFYAYAEGEQPQDAQPVYRFWSSSVIYFYTMNETEKNKLIDIYSHLWTYEGIAWYAFSPSTLTSIVPDSAQRDESLSVTIAGQDTHFTQGSGTTRVWFSYGSSTIDATSFSPSSDTSLSASFDIPGDASVGSWRVHVQDDIDDTLTLAYGFTITSSTSLTVLTPNGSEVLSAGSTYPISWSSTGSISNIVIEYSSNNGTNWTTIDTVPNTGSYSWLVPEVTSNQCLVRVTDASNTSVFDTSNSTFSIRLARLFVDADAAGADNGTSWADAYNYFQDALVYAISGDEIYVAEGMYKPDEDTDHPDGTGDRGATFQLISGVTIYGGFPSGGGAWANRDPSAYETILSGDLDGNDVQVSEPCDLLTEPTRAENSYHVVTGSGTDPNAVLDGFTITAGNANGSDPHGWGGGMCNANESSPTVTNCTFSGNSASDIGGGMVNDSGSPTLTNCTFSGNSSDCGGGMYNDSNSSPTLTNCTFSGNSATAGGGMENFGSRLTVTNCTFSENSAGDDGGGMSNVNSSPTITNCTFSGNAASSSSGGGMWNDGSSPALTNCTFSGNSAGNDGGGMSNDFDSSPTVNNCILWDNTAPTGAQIYDSGTSSTTVNYSDVQGGWAGPGGNNISADPLFIGPNGPDGIPGTADDEEDNVHLRGYSPCIDAGDNNSVPADIADLDGDGNTSERTPLDLAGNARFTDDPVTVDTGNPAPGYPEIVEMGAYERYEFCGSQAYPYPPGDVSGPDGVRDCYLDFYDFAVWAAHWLEYTGPE